MLHICADLNSVVSQALAGHNISCIRVQAGGRKLIAATQTSRISMLDMKELSIVREYGDIQTVRHPFEFDISPDGEWIVFGDHCGNCHFWSVDLGAKARSEQGTIRCRDLLLASIFLASWQNMPDVYDLGCVEEVAK